MKLYYTPGACSFAPHLVIKEAGLDVQLVKVDLATHTTEDGRNFYDINPNGYVPFLDLEDGDVLAENAAILQYLGDQSGDGKLLPAFGTRERYHVIEWVTFVSTEIHKSLGWFFRKDLPEPMIAMITERLQKRFDFIDGKLGNNSFLTGEQCTIADAYLFTVMNWCNLFHISLEQYGNLAAYMERMNQRPAVAKTRQEEGMA